MDAFLEIYTEAVRCRLRSHGPVGVMLSGGLDSGSVAILAAQTLAQTGQHLFAFSSVPAYDVTKTTPPNRCGDERPFIEATCRAAGNIDVTYIKAQKRTPLGALERGLFIHELPATVNASYIWILDTLETAQQQQIGTMFDGWGGNFTISWTGKRQHYLKTLFTQGRWKTYVQEVHAWRNVNSASLWHAIRSQVVQPFVPPMWLERYQHLVQRPRGVSKAARRSFDNEATASLNPGIYYNFRNGLTALFFELGGAFGVETRQPAMDKRVIEFCLGIPADQYTRHGKDRLLIRQAMAGLMPESVLWNKCRGLQSADIGQRIRASQAEIEKALQRLESSAFVRHYVDLPRVVAAFQTVRHSQ